MVDEARALKAFQAVLAKMPAATANVASVGIIDLEIRHLEDAATDATRKILEQFRDGNRERGIGREKGRDGGRER